VKQSTEGWRRTLGWVGLLAVLVGLNYVRSTTRLTLPTLRVEDGTHVFAHFYENRSVAEIFRFKAGYVPLVANIIGWLSVRLPTRFIPYGLTWFPLALFVGTCSIVVSRRYAAWIPSQEVRGLIAMLFVLSPLANTNLRAHTDYSIWTTLFMLILLTARPLPHRPWPKALSLGAVSLLIWSHPLTIVALPVVVFFLIRERGDRALYGITALNLIIHQLVGVASSSVFGSMKGAAVLRKITAAAGWTVIVTAKTAFAAVFGTSPLDWANGRAAYLFVVWGLVLVGTLAYVFHRVRYTRGPILLSLYYIVSLTFLSLISRGYDTAGLIEGGRRYVHVQGLLFLLIYGLLGYELGTQTLAHYDSRLPRHGPGLIKRLATTLPVGILLCHHLVMGYDVGDPPSHAVENGLIVRRFFDELAELEAVKGSHRGIYLVGSKVDDWPIVVDTR